MKPLFIVMIDVDGTMRSSPDFPERAFLSRERAEEFLAELKAKNHSYGYALMETKLDDGPDTTAKEP